MELSMSGANTLLVTPFDADWELDLPSLTSLTEYVLAGGVHGVIALGSAGEFFALSTQERVQVMKHVVQTVDGRVPVTVGIGADSTANAIELGLQAQAAGADCVLVVPPMYFDQSPEAQVIHFTAILNALDIPAMLYDGAGGVSITPDTIARVAAQAPNAQYVKVATPDPQRSAEILKAAPTVTPFAGDDMLLLAALRNGALGSATAIGNLEPKTLSDLHTAHLEGDLKRATALYAQLAPAIMATSAPKVEFIVRIKAILAAAGVIATDRVRSPLHGLDQEARDELLAVVRSVAA
ncbi:4-hydroxy-tetrahydrodipicolinate synthase [Streptomyces coacervatus]|uniref:4-hydroxy-tetrahydrodipicolinate synthase n=1 Tax=Streptomyces coacervatus TaxID=647381 RepID=A0ABP7HKQ7_9ACTN|nr:dihydrodipicolinate synthase family protein [Streptomyces coacervatus]MDF2272054.1 dihydrodipicolinate synthase family protein [Streptomyces coacervatus]